MRVERLRTKMADLGLDGMLITDPLNRRYLSGFSGTAGWLLVTGQKTMLAVDFRYYERAEREAPAWEQFRVTGTYPDGLIGMVDQVGVHRLGVEGDHLTVTAYEELRAKLPEIDLVPVENAALQLRERKDEGEVASIRAAIACADQAFAHLCQVIRPGMTEKEVAWELESHMRQHGATSTSFEIIVGSGPNGAMPHATAGDRRIEEGEPIVMDFGARVDGYCSDITRTVCLGQPDKEYEAVWQLVLQAQRAVEEALQPGMTGKDADAIARRVFAEAGYQDEFGHGLGHGVGLAIHEAPRLSPRSDEVTLEPGMVFTVEPGLYLTGWGGVRIEDIVALGETGAEVLTQAPKVPVLEVIR
jgi:Xaa-Pro aminopeptidase